MAVYPFGRGLLGVGSWVLISWLLFDGGLALRPKLGVSLGEVSELMRGGLREKNGGGEARRLVSGLRCVMRWKVFHGALLGL